MLCRMDLCGGNLANFKLSRNATSVTIKILNCNNVEKRTQKFESGIEERQINFERTVTRKHPRQSNIEAASAFKLEYPSPTWQTRGKIVMVMLVFARDLVKLVACMSPSSVVPCPISCLMAVTSEFPRIPV